MWRQIFNCLHRGRRNPALDRSYYTRGFQLVKHVSHYYLCYIFYSSQRGQRTRVYDTPNWVLCDTLRTKNDKYFQLNHGGQIHLHIECLQHIMSLLVFSKMLFNFMSLYSSKSFKTHAADSRRDLDTFCQNGALFWKFITDCYLLRKRHQI